MGKNLVNITLPDTIKTICEDAFRNNDLKSIKIPEGVISIGSCAFYGNELEDVVLPSSVIDIGSDAFSDNPLSSFALPDGNGTWTERAWGSDPDIVHNSGEAVLANRFIGAYKHGEVVIDHTTCAVTDNGDGTCSITEYYLKTPNFVLTDTIEGLAVVEIGEDAFRDADFGDNNEVINIPASVKKIEGYAFRGESVRLPQKENFTTTWEVDEVGTTFSGGDIVDARDTRYMASEHSSLSLTDEVCYFDYEDNGDGTITLIANNRQLYTLEIPEEFEGYRVTGIAEKAFSNDNIVSITIPESINYIGVGAFNGNSILTLNGEDSDGIIYAKKDDGTWDYNTIVSYGGVANEVDFISNSVNKIEKGAFFESKAETVKLPGEEYRFWKNSSGEKFASNSVITDFNTEYKYSPGFDILLFLSTNILYFAFGLGAVIIGIGVVVFRNRFKRNPIEKRRMRQKTKKATVSKKTIMRVTVIISVVGIAIIMGLVMRFVFPRVVSKSLDNDEPKFSESEPVQTIIEKDELIENFNAENTMVSFGYIKPEDVERYSGCTEDGLSIYINSTDGEDIDTRIAYIGEKTIESTGTLTIPTEDITDGPFDLTVAVYNGTVLAGSKVISNVKVFDGTGKNALEDIPKATETLIVVNANSVIDLSELTDLSSLDSLYVLDCAAKCDLSPISSLSSLKHLELSGDFDMPLEIDDLSFITGCPNLEQLELFNIGNFENLDVLAELKNLETLIIGGDFKKLQEIEDLSFLKDKIELKSLSIEFLKIGDISAVSDLKGLKSLGFYYCEIDDISPIALLDGLENLIICGADETGLLSILSSNEGIQSLSLRDSTISNIDAISSLKNLTSLDIINCLNITDFSPIATLNNLTSLSIYGDYENHLKLIDIDFVVGNKNLRNLNFHYADLSDISAVSELTELTKIRFSYCHGIQDFSPLATPNKVQKIEISGDWNESLDIGDLSFIVNKKELESLNIEYAKLEDISAISELSELKRLKLLNCFGIEDFSPLMSINNLNSFFLGGTYNEPMGVEQFGCSNCKQGIEVA